MWGEAWGQFFWGGGIALPLLSPIGIMALCAAFVGGGYVLRSRASTRWVVTLGAIVLVSGPGVVVAAVTIPHVFSNGTIADADEVNANFDAVASAIATTGAYDSGFFAVGRNQSIVLTHDLGTTAVIASVWFSANASGTSRFYGPAPLSWREHNPEFVSGATISDMSDTTVTVRTGNDFRIPTASASADGHVILTSGYVRVVMIAVGP